MDHRARKGERVIHLHRRKIGRVSRFADVCIRSIKPVALKFKDCTCVGLRLRASPKHVVGPPHQMRKALTVHDRQRCQMRYSQSHCGRRFIRSSECVPNNNGPRLFNAFNQNFTVTRRPLFSTPIHLHWRHGEAVLACAFFRNKPGTAVRHCAWLPA